MIIAAVLIIVIESQLVQSFGVRLVFEVLQLVPLLLWFERGLGGQFLNYFQVIWMWVITLTLLCALQWPLSYVHDRVDPFNIGALLPINFFLFAFPIAMEKLLFHILLLLILLDNIILHLGIKGVNLTQQVLLVRLFLAAQAQSEQAQPLPNLLSRLWPEVVRSFLHQLRRLAAFQLFSRTPF